MKPQIAFVRMCVVWLALTAFLGACRPVVTGTPTATQALPSTPSVTPVAPVRATGTGPARATPAGGSPSPGTPLPATPQPATPRPTVTPALPPGISRQYDSDRLGFSLVYPDGWAVAEAGNRTGFAPDLEHARNPDFAQVAGALVVVLKQETVAAGAGRTDTGAGPAEILARALLLELPDAPAPQVQPRMAGPLRAAEAYVAWDNPAGGRVAAYALAVEAGTRGVVFLAGAPAGQWPDEWPRLQSMAERLAIREIEASPVPPIGRLAPGDSFSARLAVVAQTVTFDGLAGDYATLVAYAGPSADPALALFDPQGRRVAVDDDSGTMLGAVVSDVPLAQTGTYSIVVWDMGGLSGEYTLQLYTSSTPSGGGPLRVNESVAGTLSFTGVQHAWTIAGRAGRPIAVAVTRTAGDAVLELRLLDARGERLASVDGVPSRPDVTLDEYPLATTGRYTLVVQSLQGAGDYRIEMRELPQATAGDEPVEVGTVYQAQVTAGAYQRWRIAETASVALQVDASLEAPVEAELFDAGGARVAWLRSDLEAPGATPVEAGYQLLVRASQASDYSFRLSRAPADPALFLPAGELLWDSVARRSLRAGRVDRYTLDAAGGEVLRLALDGEDDLGDYLALYAPDGSRLALLLGSAGDALIPEWPLVVSGTYTVDIGVYAGRGRYGVLASDVSAEASGGGVLAYGNVAFGEIEPGVRHAWAVNGAPGETLLVTVQRGAGDLALEITVYAPSGERIADATADNGVVTVGPLGLSQAGVYTVVVGGHGLTSGDYQITVE